MNRSLIKEFIYLKNLWPYLKSDRLLLVVSVSAIPFVILFEILSPLMVKRAIDQGVVAGSYDDLLYYAMLYLGSVLLLFSSRAGQNLASSVAVNRMIFRLRKKVGAWILNLSPRFHDRNMSGQLVVRATSDFDNLSNSLDGGVLTSVIDIATVIGSLIGIFYLSWVLGFGILLILPVVIFVVIFFTARLKTAHYAARKAIAEVNSYSQESIAGLSTIKILNAGDDVKSKFTDLNERFRKEQMRAVILDATLFSVVDGIATITVGVSIYLLVSWVSGDAALLETLTPGLIVAFVQYVQQLFEPLRHLSNKVALLQSAFASIARIFGILETKDFIGGQSKEFDLGKSIRIENLNFAYDSTQADPEYVLHDLNLEIPPLRSIAIVGRTGSGKSTLVKILTKFYEGYFGKVWVGNQLLGEIDPILFRRSIGIVLQDIAIFKGTIEFNISLGRADVSLGDVREAARIVGADAFIQDLKLGYQHKVAEGGKNLSVGQRQLLSFARAVVTRPKLMILDEATSSMDPSSEEIVQKGIEKLIRQQTTIMIAHRLSTIEKAHQIVVMRSGRIVEKGTYQELKEAGGEFSSLLNSKGKGHPP